MQTWLKIRQYHAFLISLLSRRLCQLSLLQVQFPAKWTSQECPPLELTQELARILYTEQRVALTRCQQYRSNHNEHTTNQPGHPVKRNKENLGLGWKGPGRNQSLPSLIAMQPWFYATKMLCCHLLSRSGTRRAFYVAKRVVIYCVPQKRVLRGHTEGEGIQRGRRGWKPRKPGCSMCTFQTTLFSTADQEEEVVGALWLLPSVVTNSPDWVPRPQPHTSPPFPPPSPLWPCTQIETPVMTDISRLPLLYDEREHICSVLPPSPTEN